jgi:hypothetical protein
VTRDDGRLTGIEEERIPFLEPFSHSIPMKPPAEYKKHVYWLTPDEATRVSRDLEAGGLRVPVAKGVVCTPLDERNRVSVVPPGVWNETCSRQGSWYRASDRNGLFLVVSSFELDTFGGKRAAVISKSDFVPPRLATMEEKREMIRDQGFAERIPPEWGVVGETERRIYLRWAHRLGSEAGDYDLLFLSHTANHANFIKPRFFWGDGNEVVPYSIDISAHLCSCCLELFQVLGREHRRKLVRPCPGASIFARLKPDRYLLVENSPDDW